ncbi:MAG TPA: cell envelope integrity protein TolA [Oleiagrimonas sp.]|nr:cell envelope integrity protein TolA [Oleiagrimonas sp.]
MMDESKRTPRAILWSAVLHLGLAAFLLLTTISCTTWEHMFSVLPLPESWNPMTCTRPVSLKGPVIEATLVGVASAPPSPPIETKAEKPSITPPKASKPKIEPEKPKLQPLKTLPPPPKRPDVKDQQKVVARAEQKAEQAKREQEEKQKQRMAELEAQQRQEKLDKILKQLDQARNQSQHASRQSDLEKQKLAQLKDLKKAKSKAPPQPAGVNEAKQARSGSNGTSNDAYEAAIQNAVTQAWLRPDNIPEGAVCPIHIVQIPGGQVISVTIEPSCPFDAAGRRSVKNAVLRAQPLPYKGFEKAFRSDITLNFKVNN